MFEGIYASSWKGSCQFLELSRTPLCCAISRNHRLANAAELSMPYGLVYAKEPTAATMKFIGAVRKLKD